MSESSEEEVSPPSSSEKKVPKYERAWLIICAVCSLGPFALPLIWRHPRLTWYWKLYATFLVAGITWVCIVLVRDLWGQVQEKLDIIRELES